MYITYPYNYPYNYPWYPQTTTTTTSQTSVDPEKIALVEKLIKKGHISLEQGLLLLKDVVTTITYTNPQPDPPYTFTCAEGSGVTAAPSPTFTCYNSQLAN